MNIKEIKKAQKRIDAIEVTCPECEKITTWKVLKDWGKCLNCVKAYNTNEFSSFYKNK